MSTASEKAQFTRLASNASALVRVIELPKLADAIGPKLPFAAVELRDWDAKVETWRRSIQFGPAAATGGILLKAGTSGQTTQTTVSGAPGLRGQPGAAGADADPVMAWLNL
jgi:hypothetical protein